MNLIVAVDKNWAIGYQNKLLISIPSDMEFFKKMTMGKVVVMGKNTLESLPHGRPLKNRTNIVIALEKDYYADGCVMAYSIDEALEAVKGYDTDDVFVIGGGSIYNQMLPYCSRAYVTYVDKAYSADTWIKNLDEHPDEWDLEYESEENTYFDVEYYFRSYVRKQ